MVVLRGIESGLRRMLGQFGRATELAEQAIGMYGGVPVRGLGEGASDAASLLFLLATAQLHMRQSDKASVHLRAVARSAAHEFERVRAVGAHALIEAVEGRISSAAALVEEISADIQDPAFAAVTLTHAIVAIDRALPDEAEELLAEVEAVAPGTEFRLVISTGRIRIALLRDDPAAAGRIAQTVLHQQGPSSPYLRSFFQEAYADSLIARRRARRAAEVARDPAVASDLTASALGRALLMSGQTPQASLFASQQLQRGSGAVRMLVSLNIVLAVAAARRSQGDEATATAKAAAELSAKHDLREPWRLVAPEDRQLLDEFCRDAIDRSLWEGMTMFARPLTIPTLSKREIAVLSAARTGKPLHLVAAELRVSVNTVKTQLRSAYKKLGANSRSEAIHDAYEWGILVPDRAGDRQRKGA